MAINVVQISLFVHSSSYCYNRNLPVLIFVNVQDAAAGEISVNVAGFSMGNAWISPGDQAMSNGPLLYQLVNNAIHTVTEYFPGRMCIADLSTFRFNLKLRETDHHNITC